MDWKSRKPKADYHQIDQVIHARTHTVQIIQNSTRSTGLIADIFTAGLYGYFPWLVTNMSAAFWPVGNCSCLFFFRNVSVADAHSVKGIQLSPSLVGSRKSVVFLMTMGGG